MRKEVCSLLYSAIIFCILIFPVCMFTGIQPVYAQQKSDDDLSNPFKLSMDELLETRVSGVSRYEQWLEKAPASVIVITHRQIQERGYEDLSDLLKDTPGFDISDDAGRFGEYYTIRGIGGNDRFLVLIDGHKINPASGTYISVGNSISIQFVKQVEIIYGPASSIYGADAFAGIINITPMQFHNNKVSARINSGSFGRIDLSGFIRMKLTKNLLLEAMARSFRSKGLDFTRREPDDYSIVNHYQSPLTPRFQQPVNDKNLFIKTKYKNYSLAWFHQYFDEGNGRGMGADFYVFNKANRWKMVTDLIWSTYNKTFGQDGLLTIDLSYINHTQSPQTQFLKWRVPGDTSEAFSQFMTGKDKTFRGIASYNDTISSKIKMIAGLEYEFIKSIPPYANDELLGDSFKYEGQNAVLIDAGLTVKEKRWAGYSQLTWSPYHWIDVILGGRFDYSSYYKGTFNPRLGIILRPALKTSLKLLYGSAFQAPSLFYRFEQFGTPLFVFRSTNEIRTQENPSWQLKNQKLKSYEASLNHKFSAKTKMSLSIYHLALHDLIERVMYDTTGSTLNKYFNTYTNGQRNENIGRERSTGINFTFNSALNSDLEGYFYYSFTDASTRTPSTVNGNEGTVPVARVSPHKLWLGFTCRNLFKRVTLSPRFKWVGPINTTPLNTLYHGKKQPGFTSLDVSFRINSGFRGFHFTAYIGNLLDSRIRHAGLFQQGNIYAPDIPQPGIHFRIGFEIGNAARYPH